MHTYRSRNATVPVPQRSWSGYGQSTQRRLIAKTTVYIIVPKILYFSYIPDREHIYSEKFVMGQ